ncbi:hypothetical protein TraAM80_04449 [Trypanosoma rangeli]|uniref:Uncharacterized protein n=1 Tax=Trypanosoma rangeli TaxID=5698 RepID=A0A3R7KCV9_TRYRA|nr:uncharacterized protein TraAM80_04449 [Trypanosoma rangeli]RNF05527.1 hypothetical protein TraAM80_04449 [Trypanosoma rangeli]|eukprot:RNF05527.1 hypothetical protein TraAM80_04449 [Trypanosoma rangeli]
MSMISLKFTLYRIVCDVTSFTGIFAPDAEGHCIPETSGFVCCWCRVPRLRTTAPIEPSGSTSATFFKALGSDMTLSFSNATGSLGVDTNKDVIAFHMKPLSYSGGLAPVVAKGTLDPLPYVGKAAKNYAIKLRDAANQVVGKLLFALEAWETDGETGGVPATGNDLSDRQGAASVDKFALSPDSKPSAATHHRHNHRHGDNGSENVFPSQIQVHKKEYVPQSSPSATVTQHNSTETFPDRHDSVENAVTAKDVSVAQRSNTQGSAYMEMDIEQIIVKNESISLNNPAPLLLGGSYYLKIRYGGFSSSTPSIECRSPIKLKYAHRVGVIGMPERAHKLRFSLWEDDRQVAGFSLDPAKFRVPPGVWKEYSIPFRYYPTQQALSLELAVRRVEAAKGPGTKERKKNAFIVPNLESSLEARGASSHSTDGTMKFQEKAEQKPEPLKTISCNQEGVPVLSSCVENADLTVYRRCNSAKDYVQKGYLDPNVRESHWKSAVQQAYEDTSNEATISLQRQPQQRGGGSRDATTNTSCFTAHNDSQENNAGAVEAGGVEQAGQSRGADSVKRIQAFLDQIGSRNLRSSSATRQTMQGSELPVTSSSHRGRTATTMEDCGDSRSGERDTTPLRVPASLYTSLDRKDDVPLSDWGTDNTYARDHVPWERSASTNGSYTDLRRYGKLLNGTPNGRGRRADLLHSRGGARPHMPPSLMDEWLEWREKRTSAQVSRTCSVNSAFSRDESVCSIASRNRAVSPLPTKSFAKSSEQRPYQPQYVPRSASRSSAGPGRPPLPMRR